MRLGMVVLEGRREGGACVEKKGEKESRPRSGANKIKLWQEKATFVCLNHAIPFLSFSPDTGRDEQKGPPPSSGKKRLPITYHFAIGSAVAVVDHHHHHHTAVRSSRHQCSPSQQAREVHRLYRARSQDIA